MFTKLKSAFLGRNKCMSQKARNELKRFAEVEFKNDAEFAEWMIETGQFDTLRKIQETCK